jgi:hypothetical protein
MRLVARGHYWSVKGTKAWSLKPYEMVCQLQEVGFDQTE